MTNRPAVLGALLAVVALAGLMLADILTTHESVALSPLFAVAPLLACAVLRASGTAVFAVLAVVAALSSGVWNDNADSPQHLVRLVDVAVIGLAATMVAEYRIRRERQMVRLTQLAEVAQRAVLPVLPAHARRTDIAVRYVSATQDAMIGGDLYDCYHSRTHTRFLLGDVRGKGLAAVEQAARVIRAFRQAAAVQPDLGEVAVDMNDYLIPFFDDEEFVTALVLDLTDAQRPQLVSAGHPAPLLVRPDGRCHFLETQGHLPLGLGDVYRSQPFTWDAGDRLLLYTDGVSEARDARGDFLEVEDLAGLLVGGTLDEALDRLLHAVRQHVVRQELGDDVAVMLLEHAEVRDQYEPLAGEHDWRQSLPR